MSRFRYVIQIGHSPNYSFDRNIRGEARLKILVITIHAE